TGRGVVPNEYVSGGAEAVGLVSGCAAAIGFVSGATSAAAAAGLAANEAGIAGVADCWLVTGPAEAMLLTARAGFCSDASAASALNARASAFPAADGRAQP